ncbi:hypothetical protein AAFF_G00138040 [Aldrovandia affinis]|uniref:Uncharacterized protein n=1 Tax=Aldrovandia affinis TaxID=143900 RepID=A0AAD7X2P5_9TELE|nr:hypothetical protein AAFF_G00138040 [Aldrovandia affinis]
MELTILCLSVDKLRHCERNTCIHSSRTEGAPDNRCEAGSVAITARTRGMRGALPRAAVGSLLQQVGAQPNDRLPWRKKDKEAAAQSVLRGKQLQETPFK